MKTAVKVVCAVCVLALCVAAIPVIFYGFGILVATVHNYGDQVSDGGGFSYLLRDKWSKKAAVSRYVYDPEADRAVIEIPAAYGEYPVEGLGGYVGTGFPSPFFVDIKGLDPTAGVSPSNGSFDWYLGDKTEYVCYDLTLNIGPGIEEIYAEQDALLADQKLYIVRVYVNCDPENRRFYSEDGILYKKNGERVEGLIYWDQTF